MSSNPPRFGDSYLPGGLTRVSTVVEVIWARRRGTNRPQLVTLTGSPQDVAIGVLALLSGVASAPDEFGERAAAAAREYMRAVGYNPSESTEFARVGPDVIAKKP